MMYGLYESKTAYWINPFPTRLARGEYIRVIGTKPEMERLQVLLCAEPISGETYLYLMTDRRTGLTKIGTSKNPQYRESTLQSDNPMVELLQTWKASLSHERTMHKLFARYRVRGEWFDLTQEQIDSVGAYMCHQEFKQQKYQRYKDEVSSRS